jgi:hypothetical protein
VRRVFVFRNKIFMDIREGDILPLAGYTLALEGAYF